MELQGTSGIVIMGNTNDKDAKKIVVRIMHKVLVIIARRTVVVLAVIIVE